MDGDTVTFQIMSAAGIQSEVEVATDALVSDLRAAVDMCVPAGTHLKLVQGAQVLFDKQLVNALDPEQIVFAVIAQETDIEKLLLAAGQYEGYQAVIAQSLQKDASSLQSAGLNAAAFIDLGVQPSILDVLEDMAGGGESLCKTLLKDENGLLKFGGDKGELILPSIDLSTLLKAKGVDKVSSVTLKVGVNSDASNQGLGVVIEANPIMDDQVDEKGIPSYVYNGYGLSKDSRRNAIKFHPGMRGGELRIEGVGGFNNTDIGFTPENWTRSGHKLHQLEITCRVDGTNELRFIGTGENQEWKKQWHRKLFDGRYAPAMYCWLDLGKMDRPLYVSDISLSAELTPVAEASPKGGSKGGYTPAPAPVAETPAATKPRLR